MGRAQAAHFHSARLLSWAWSMWREVRLWHGHSLSVAFGQVGLFVLMTQTDGFLHMPLVKGNCEAVITYVCVGLLLAELTECKVPVWPLTETLLRV